jgi:hypothetical protein
MLLPLHALEGLQGLGALLDAQSVSPNESMSQHMLHRPKDRFTDLSDVALQAEYLHQLNIAL